jgi:hypothetical protein
MANNGKSGQEPDLSSDFLKYGDLFMLTYDASVQIISDDNNLQFDSEHIKDEIIMGGLMATGYFLIH